MLEFYIENKNTNQFLSYGDNSVIGGNTLFSNKDNSV